MTTDERGGSAPVTPETCEDCHREPCACAAIALGWALEDLPEETWDEPTDERGGSAPVTPDNLSKPDIRNLGRPTMGDHEDAERLDSAYPGWRTREEREMPKPLYKTTIVVWSEYDPSEMELEDLAREAMVGDAYCSRTTTEFVPDPPQDKEWDRTEFFDAVDA